MMQSMKQLLHISNKCLTQREPLANVQPDQAISFKKNTQHFNAEELGHQQHKSDTHFHLHLNQFVELSMSIFASLLSPISDPDILSLFVTRSSFGHMASCFFPLPDLQRDLSDRDSYLQPVISLKSFPAHGALVYSIQKNLIALLG